MISYLQGKIIGKQANALTVLVNDIGYKVFVPLGLVADVKLNSEVVLHTYEQQTETEHHLFGFDKIKQLQMFELLLSVSGIGPKSALNILSVVSDQDISEAIILNQPALLTKVSGVGQKIAERLVLELKNKVGGLAGESAAGLTGTGEELDALMQLGYGLSTARAALQKVDPQITDSAQRVKAALKFL